MACWQCHSWWRNVVNLLDSFLIRYNLAAMYLFSPGTLKVLVPPVRPQRAPPNSNQHCPPTRSRDRTTKPFTALLRPEHITSGSYLSLFTEEPLPQTTAQAPSPSGGRRLPTLDDAPAIPGHYSDHDPAIIHPTSRRPTRLP